jgi:hypothetical protein
VPIKKPKSSIWMPVAAIRMLLGLTESQYNLFLYGEKEYK